MNAVHDGAPSVLRDNSTAMCVVHLLR